MKDARTYERKVKKLLGGMKKKAFKASAPPMGDDLIRRLIESIFLADATDRDVEKAMAEIQKEFVDYNELRVAPEKDVIECLDKNHPRIRGKVQVLTSVLNGIYSRVNCLAAEYMHEMSKRDVRRHLRELGMPPFGEALVGITCFGMHAIPVDDSLFEVLQMNACVHASSDVTDTQAFLERIVAQKDGMSAHVFFREYVAKHAKVLEKKRKADAERRAAEEKARRQAEAEAKRKAQAQAARQAQLEAEKEAKKAQREAEKLAKAAEMKAAKKTKKKTAKKVATKAKTKKVAKPSSVKKGAKKVAKKTATKKAKRK